MNKLFEIYISKSGSHGGATGVSIVLPATPYEVLDALEKARITDESIYSVEVMDCEFVYLPQFIAPGTDIHELNHLAHRLAGLDKWQLDCFEGMAMMDAAKMGHSPIPVDRLINMTHSTEECQAIYEAHDDASLGRFYVGNDFPIIPPNLPEAVYEILDYDSIGRKARIGEGGVFTQNGYVVQNGEMACLYHKGDAVPIEKPDYMVLLKVTKGYCDTPYAYIKLPAKSDALSQAVQATGAASAEECVCTAEDCIIPWMSELTTDELAAAMTR